MDQDWLEALILVLAVAAGCLALAYLASVLGIITGLL